MIQYTLQLEQYMKWMLLLPESCTKFEKIGNAEALENQGGAKFSVKASIIGPSTLSSYAGSV